MALFWKTPKGNWRYDWILATDLADSVPDDVVIREARSSLLEYASQMYAQIEGAGIPPAPDPAIRYLAEFGAAMSKHTNAVASARKALERNGMFVVWPHVPALPEREQHHGVLQVLRETLEKTFP